MVLPCSDPSTGIRVDFILSFSPYEKTALGRARRIKVRQAEVVFVSLEDLVIHKILAGRPRDLEDVRHVLIRNPKADLAYIREWLREFSDSLGESFLTTFDHLAGGLE
jgi:predicted nucleotidyltransferase